MGRVEATRLWKDIETLNTEAKYKLAYHVFMFFVAMFLMLYMLIAGLDH